MRRGALRVLAAAAIGLGAPLAVRAQDVPGASTGSSTPSGSTDASGLSAICTDRPTKSNAACTVDAGHFQYESDVVNGTFQHLDGVTTDTWLVTNPTLKYGLSSNVDIEANLSPLEIVRTHEKGGPDLTVAGVSDLYLRLKYAFINLDNGGLQVAVIPYVKAPTARPGIGNGVVEGGAIVPIHYQINSLVTVTFDPEVDAYKDSTGGGHHVNTAQLLNLAFSLPANVTLYGELWGDWNFDPAGTIRQYSADVAAAYGISKYLQIDGGLNFGLNRYTPGVQAYVGVSQKF